MRIALINGPMPDGSLFMREGRCTQGSSIWSTQWPPISLAYLSAVARREGHDPLLLDCPQSAINLRRLLHLLRDQRPGLCVLAVSTPTLEVDMETARRIRQAVPDTRLAIIGVHATVMDLEILARYPQVDFVIRHEPEQTFAELLRLLAQGEDPRDVEGLSLRGPGGPTQNPGRPFLPDLDDLPFPDWGALDVGRYRLPFSSRRFLILAPTRGCPYACSFCTAAPYYGQRVRRRTVGSLIQEIKHDRRLFGVDDFFMWAETFTLNRRFVLELCQAMIKETPGIRWTCNSRTDTVDVEMLQTMARAGCWMMSFGLESSDGDVLHRLGKKLRHDDVVTPVRQAREAGIRTVGHFVLGLPGDTPATMRRTIQSALELDLDFAQFYAAAPFVGSPLYDQAVSAGEISPEDFSRISQSSSSLNLRGAHPQLVDLVRAAATLRFYLRPRQVLRLGSVVGAVGLPRQVARELARRARTLASW